MIRKQAKAIQESIRQIEKEKTLLPIPDNSWTIANDDTGKSLIRINNRDLFGVKFTGSWETGAIYWKKDEAEAILEELEKEGWEDLRLVSRDKARGQYESFLRTLLSLRGL